MVALDILRQMIQGIAQIPLTQDPYGNWIVTLNEPQVADSCVTIHKMPQQAIIISLDEFWSLEKMFTSMNGQCKRADFIIIADTGTRKVIVYIEMKRTHAQENTVVQQLTGARCFIAYCKALAQAPAFWGEQDFLCDYEERFVYLGHTRSSIDKRPTCIRPNYDIHDHPENLLKLHAPHYVTLDRLIGSHR